MTGRRPISRRSMLALGAAALAGSGLSVRAGHASADTDVLATAVQAYIFGYPLVLMDASREAAAAHLPVNTIAHATALPTPDSTYVVRPNLDTLYSLAWLDLRKEPVLLSVPAMPDRYWLMQVLDMWTNSFQDPSSIDPRTTSAPYTYAVTGPTWNGSLPAGITPLPVATDTAWLIGRIQSKGAGDIPAVNEIQQQLRLSPLSTWSSAGPGATITGMQQLGGATKPPDIVAAMDAPTYFQRLCTIMADNPPAAEDAPALARFATLGITPGRYTATAPRALLDLAAELAKRQITTSFYSSILTGAENRWFTPEVIGVYGTDYLSRAAIAHTGLGANLPRDAIYLNTLGVATPTLRYRLHFPAGQTPPNNAFWSITAYTSGGYLVPNEAATYAVGSTTVHPNPDGSIDLAIQPTAPDASVPQGNWLPIPTQGQFTLTMRIYAPKPEALDGTWQPPALMPLL
ncbi:DUF1254 domain-containing protein [Nocardia huaxiensis]|nr:DUF1254 domain-containing protein [Nocardia huaxiensis]